MKMPYKTWNDAIGRYFFGPHYAEQRVFLTIDDDTLWKISQEDDSGLRFAFCDAAAQAFVAAVRDELCRYGEWAFKQPREDEYPLFLGFLAIQVLAVFRMGTDGSLSPNAYWGSLRALLGDTTSPYMPLGLQPNQHQALWRQGLGHWVNDLQQGRWGTVSLPPEMRQDEKRHHVGLPKSQALLTSADLALLPPFYQEADLQSGEDVEEAFLLEKVQQLLKKPSLFHPHGRRVLSDPERNLLACGQIRDHLRQGNWDDPIGTARLWLTMQEHDSQELDGGLIIGEKVLQEIRLPDILGKTKYAYAPGKMFRPLHTSYHVTILDAFQGRWEERRHAKPGEEVLLLTPQREVLQQYKNVRDYVAAEEGVTLYYAECGSSPRLQDSIKLGGLPRDWCALRFHVRAELSVTMPSWCRLWLYAPPLQLLGGLRLARQTWMAGAGPTVRVRAADVATVSIDGRSYDVRNRHITPQQAPALEQLGRHIIQIEHSSSLQCKVEDRDILPERLIDGWIHQGQEWPSLAWQGKPSDRLLRTGLRLQGPVVSGQGKQTIGLESLLARQWLELAIQMRGRQMGQQASALKQMSKTPHPLVQQMQQIVEPRLPWFAKMTKG